MRPASQSGGFLVFSSGSVPKLSEASPLSALAFPPAKGRFRGCRGCEPVFTLSPLVLSPILLLRHLLAWQRMTEIVDFSGVSTWSSFLGVRRRHPCLLLLPYLGLPFCWRPVIWSSPGPAFQFLQCLKMEAVAYIGFVACHWFLGPAKNGEVMPFPSGFRAPGQSPRLVGISMSWNWRQLFCSSKFQVSPSGRVGSPCYRLLFCRVLCQLSRGILIPLFVLICCVEEILLWCQAHIFFRIFLPGKINIVSVSLSRSRSVLHSDLTFLPRVPRRLWLLWFLS